MGKKIHKQSSPEKKKGASHYIKRHLFLSFISLLFFTLTSLVVTHHSSQPSCANSKSCKSDLSMKIENNVDGVFEGKKVHPPVISSQDTNNHSVLGTNTESGEKHIFVDLSTQTLVAYQGTTQILKTFVATGRWNKTPTGNFHIWEKLLSTRMAGGEGADAYNLPNVPYVMYFYNDFGLHGAYWHDNFGHTMSHGCVNMRQVDAKALYEWATVGTEVSVCDQIIGNNQCIQKDPVQ